MSVPCLEYVGNAICHSTSGSKMCRFNKVSTAFVIKILWCLCSFELVQCYCNWAKPLSSNAIILRNLSSVNRLQAGHVYMCIWGHLCYIYCQEITFSLRIASNDPGNGRECAMRQMHFAAFQSTRIYKAVI